MSNDHEEEVKISNATSSSMSYRKSLTRHTQVLDTFILPFKGISIIPWLYLSLGVSLTAAAPPPTPGTYTATLRHMSTTRSKMRAWVKEDVGHRCKAVAAVVLTVHYGLE